MTEVLTAALAGFLILVGIGHFVVPGYFERLVPQCLPAPRLAVGASGVVEVLVGAGLLAAPTRMPAAWAATGLMTVYVLTHVDALLRARASNPRWLDRPVGAVARVVVNLGYLVWAGAVALTV